MTDQLAAIYGTIPDRLVDLPSPARQLSPLLPGSQPLEEMAESSLQAAAVLAPPGTVERRFVLARILKALAPGGELTALAPKDKGGSRLGGELRAFGLEVEESGKRHHRICVGTRPEAPTGLDEAIADGAPRIVPDLGLWSQPGIFSWDRLDPGTALLLQALPALSGRGADLGCGIGLLAKAALTSPKVSELTLIDIDRRAVECARHNIEDARARFVWRDVRAGTGLVGLDFVVTNPPFHDAGVEDKGLGQGFIKRAAESLRPGGRCWLVANRHLPYEAALGTLFKIVRPVTDGAGFKVIEAIK